jgi:hypothetical protein
MGDAETHKGDNCRYIKEGKEKWFRSVSLGFHRTTHLPAFSSSREGPGENSPARSVLGERRCASRSPVGATEKLGRRPSPQPSLRDLSIVLLALPSTEGAGLLSFVPPGRCGLRNCAARELVASSAQEDAKRPNKGSWHLFYAQSAVSRGRNEPRTTSASAALRWNTDSIARPTG